MTEFGKAIAEAYAVEGATIDLGRGIHDKQLAPDAVVQLPLRMMNRHGLIAGATGTGKTITLQTISEQLSAAGVPVFAADVKGDVSGGLPHRARGRRGGVRQGVAAVRQVRHPDGRRERAREARGRLARAEAHEAEPASAPGPRAKRRRKVMAPGPAGGLERLGDFLGSREGKALQRKVTRGLFGMLKKRL